MIVIYFASVDRIYDVAYEEDDKQTQACSSEVWRRHRIRPAVLPRAGAQRPMGHRPPRSSARGAEGGSAGQVVLYLALHGTYPFYDGDASMLEATLAAPAARPPRLPGRWPRSSFRFHNLFRKCSAFIFMWFLPRRRWSATRRGSPPSGRSARGSRRGVLLMEGLHFKGFPPPGQC